MSSNHGFHFGVVGDGADAMITAFGSSVAMGVPCAGEQPKAWTCATCTFHNAETMGRFCSMCGGRRFGGEPATTENAPNRSESADTLGDLYPMSPVRGFRRIGSLQRHPEGRATFSLGSNHASLLSEEEQRQSGAGLEMSFSFLALLEDTETPMENAPAEREEKKPALSARDFQMSFANWSISDNGAWTCTACTFVNTNALHLTCEICGQNRPPKKTANQGQRVMQEMMETSFRTGQHDFLRKQQEKIEEIEDRVIAAERVQEIAEIQADLMEEFKEEENEIDGSVAQHHMRMSEKVQLAEDYIDQVEKVRLQEHEEQEVMEATLENKRRELDMERMPTERYLNHREPLSTPNPDSARSQVRAQERLLSDWKESWRNGESDVEALKRRQQAIFEKMRGKM
jgi:hypothetical protein